VFQLSVFKTERHTCAFAATRSPANPLGHSASFFCVVFFNEEGGRGGPNMITTPPPLPPRCCIQLPAILPFDDDTASFTRVPTVCSGGEVGTWTCLCRVNRVEGGRTNDAASAFLLLVRFVSNHPSP